MSQGDDQPNPTSVLYFYDGQSFVSYDAQILVIYDGQIFAVYDV